MGGEIEEVEIVLGCGEILNSIPLEFRNKIVVQQILSLLLYTYDLIYVQFPPPNITLINLIELSVIVIRFPQVVVFMIIIIIIFVRTLNYQTKP